VPAAPPAANPAAQPEVKPPAPTKADRFAQIDRQVRNLSPSDQRCVPELITVLASIARNDREKARVIYIWITGNIAYDTDSCFKGIPGGL
jgi:hypothetical protein